MSPSKPKKDSCATTDGHQPQKAPEGCSHDHSHGADHGHTEEQDPQQSGPDEAHKLILPDEARQAAILSLMYRVFRENSELKNAYDKLLQQTVKALLYCLEERDAYTYGHSMRVMEYALLIGRGARLKESEMRNLELSAVFHDLGKIGIPDCVLFKPARLDNKEQKAMEKHPVKSAEILSLIDAFANVVPGVRHHHERVDGKGYPSQLSGSQIPIISRIILVADTFDAMTSTRPYRKALPIDTAYAELERFAGSQFDPDVVKVFLRAHKSLLAEKKDEIVVPFRKAA